jgi:hypothetical protein
LKVTRTFGCETSLRTPFGRQRVEEGGAKAGSCGFEVPNGIAAKDTKDDVIMLF